MTDASMAGIGTEVLFILLLIVANGVFAMSEIAIVSARKARLQQRASDGDLRAQTALEMASAPNRFLSTVQIGISLVGVLAGAYGGARLSAPLAEVLAGYPALAPYSAPLALGLVVLVITYLSLVLGELVPKRIGLNSPERIAVAMARPMRALSTLAAPLVHLLSASTDLILRLLRIRPSAEPPVTEEEITVLIEQGTEAGVFEEAEQEIVERVFRLGDQQVGALMTPRRHVVWLDLHDPVERNQQKITDSPYSRFVVCQEGLDHVLGIVNVKDLLAQKLSGLPLDLTTALRQPHFVPDSLPSFRVLELFRSSGVHVALVVNEYGSMEGLVTMNDLLEALVGDIPDVGDTEAPYVVQRDAHSWLIDGLLSIEEFKDLFGLRTLPGDATGNFRTLGGFVVTYLGRIPRAADHFTWEDLRFEVVDMDGSRVDKLLISRLPTVAEDEAE